jgi:hypothetical protein
MIDPYDPHHPDGFDDEEDLPGRPVVTLPWLDDEEPADEDWTTSILPDLPRSVEPALG